MTNIESWSPTVLIWLVVAGVAVGMLLFGLGFIGFFALLFRSERRPKSVEDLAGEREELDRQLQDLVTSLRPWSPEALTRLAANWEARWTSVGRRFTARGTIPSLDSGGGALAAFALRLHGFLDPDGQLVARTTAQRFDYRITKERTTIAVDGEPLGAVLREGTIVDADGVHLGSAVRPRGTPVAINIGPSGGAWDNRARQYPVIFGERTVGLITNPPFRPFRVRRAGQDYATQLPAVAVEQAPRELEATWLLALAILQIVHYTLREAVR